MKYTILSIFIFTILSFTVGCQSMAKPTSNNEKVSSKMRGNATHYTEDDIYKIYNDIKSKSFADSPKGSKLIFKDLSPAFGMAHPFSLNLIVDIDGINKHQWPKEAVIGLFAHELSHMVSYQRRGFFGRMLFTWNYPFSVAKRQEVEHEADSIAIERGYGKELVQERIFQFRIDDAEHLRKQKQVYFLPETLKQMISNKK